MSTDTFSGKVDQVVGKVKEGVGEAVGNEHLANSGAADQVKGNAKEAWGGVKDAASDVRDNARTDAAYRSGQADSEAHTTANTTREGITGKAEELKDSIVNKVENFRDRH